MALNFVFISCFFGSTQSVLIFMAIRFSLLNIQNFSAIAIKGWPKTVFVGMINILGNGRRAKTGTKHSDKTTLLENKHQLNLSINGGGVGWVVGG